MASLIDLGQMTNQAIQLGQLAEMQRRSQLIERDREIDQKRMEVQENQYKRQQEKDRGSILQTLATDPLHAYGPVGQAALKELVKSQGLELSDEQVVAGYDAFLGLVQASTDRDMPQAEREKKAYRAMQFAPHAAKQFLESAEKFQNLDNKTRLLTLNVLEHEEKYKKMTTEQAKLELQKGMYSAMGGVMTQLFDTVNVTDTKGSRDFPKTFQKILNAKSEAERMALQSTVKDLGGKMQERAMFLSTAFNKLYEAKNRELRPAVGLIQQAEAEGREVGETELNQVKALELLDTAKDAIDKWVANPYDKQAYTRLQNTMREVQQAGAATKKGIEDINGVRQGMLDNAVRKTDLQYAKDQREVDLAAAQSEFAGLPDEQQTTQKAAAIAKRFKGVKVEEILLANPLKFKKAAAEIHIDDRKFTPEQAGRVSAINRSITELQNARSLLVKKDGEIDRGVLFSANLFGGLPFSKGRDVNRYIEDAVDTKLRLETGAAANKDEVKRIALRFKPSVRDSDETIRGKFEQLEAFMKDAFNVLDPTGEVRSRISGQSAGRPPVPADVRFQQLQKQNKTMTKEQIFQQMIQEGY